MSTTTTYNLNSNQPLEFTGARRYDFKNNVGDQLVVTLSGDAPRVLLPGESQSFEGTGTIHVSTPGNVGLSVTEHRDEIDELRARVAELENENKLLKQPKQPTAEQKKGKK